MKSQKTLAIGLIIFSTLLFTSCEKEEDQALKPALKPIASDTGFYGKDASIGIGEAADAELNEEFNDELSKEAGSQATGIQGILGASLLDSAGVTLSRKKVNLDDNLTAYSDNSVVFKSYAGYMEGFAAPLGRPHSGVIGPLQNDIAYAMQTSGFTVSVDPEPDYGSPANMFNANAVHIAEWIDPEKPIVIKIDLPGNHHYEHVMGVTFPWSMSAKTVKMEMYDNRNRKWVVVYNNENFSGDSAIVTHRLNYVTKVRYTIGGTANRIVTGESGRYLDGKRNEVIRISRLLFASSHKNEGYYLSRGGGEVVGNLGVAGNVGIGTYGTEARLDIRGAANKPALRVVSFSGGGGGDDIHPVLAPVAIHEALLVDTIGQVGIGTIDPQAKLHIFHDSIANLAIDSPGFVNMTIGRGNSSMASLVIDGRDSAKINMFGNQGLGQWEVGLLDGNNFQILDMTFENAPDQPPTATRFFIENTTGYVGIGTDDPEARLHVFGTVKASDFHTLDNQSLLGIIANLQARVAALEAIVLPPGDDEPPMILLPGAPDTESDTTVTSDTRIDDQPPFILNPNLHVSTNKEQGTYSIYDMTQSITGTLVGSGRGTESTAFDIDPGSPHEIRYGTIDGQVTPENVTITLANADQIIEGTYYPIITIPPPPESNDSPFAR